MHFRSGRPIFGLLTTDTLEKKHIRKIAVLGAGLMGSGIACHLAGAGFEVLLLDLPSAEGPRNARVDLSLRKCLQSQPSPIFDQSFSSRIQTGNFDDDLEKVSSCDWIVEVIAEKAALKQQLYDRLEVYRKPGTLVTSNTSGIPLRTLCEGLSEDFRKHFLGTHFFNPPRYLRLLEIIPGPGTQPDVVEFMMDFGRRFLGKQTVLCKDTPGFIANRIGVVYMARVMELAEASGLSIGAVDRLTGPALGRPKTGTFRLADLVGLDTAEYVTEGLRTNCPDDNMLNNIHRIKATEFLLGNQWLGTKSGKGFYAKTDERDEKGKPKILELNLSTLTYATQAKAALPSLELSKKIEDLPKRMQALIALDDPGANLLRSSLGFLLAYSAHRIPEIADAPHAIDQAMETGYAWPLGPFRIWDALGWETAVKLILEAGHTLPKWATDMEAAGINKFYLDEADGLKGYDPSSAAYSLVPGSAGTIRLSVTHEQNLVFRNEEVRLHDIGDGVLCLEFASKHNAIGEGILRGIQHSIDLAETQGWKGLVIGNQAQHFSVGANLMLIGMLAFQQEYEQLDMAVRLFQQTSLRCRYSAIPVVCACQGYTFGGGTELLMYCDAAVVAAESYIGLVEMSVGLLPGGGGTVEFARRLSREFKTGEVLVPQLIHRFRTIATASVSTSAHEAYGLGYLSFDRDRVAIDGLTNIRLAKQRVLDLSGTYIQPPSNKAIRVLGRSGLAALYVASNSMRRANHASEHDHKIANKIAWVLCGGDLSEPQEVSEQYLLDLERDAFLSLCTEPKTLERIQYMLENNKPLRN
ncbi:MAG: 3-hydroxyacyl-CoA dehydrogenase/enoyl-CoA hydratase family protein [Saprospiraceae bacterium]|nr:3-hydroxyacyl-CoA dehydrogenase/enoyl-CoA hydratase family protein [Saprospiraceae bacterium]